MGEWFGSNIVSPSRLGLTSTCPNDMSDKCISGEANVTGGVRVASKSVSCIPNDVACIGELEFGLSVREDSPSWNRYNYSS